MSNAGNDRCCVRNLSEKQFFEYLFCPVKYSLLYGKQIRQKEEISETVLLNRICRRFYHELMGGKVLDISELKEFWDKLCEKYKDEISPKACLNGMGKITKLFLWAKSEELAIVDASAPYRLIFGKGNRTVEFTGKTGTLASGRGGLYLLETDFSESFPDTLFLGTRLRHSIDCMALRENYGTDACVRIHHVKSGRDFYTIRQEEDFRRLEKSVLAVAESIDRGIFYPRETVFCKKCEYLGFCRMWQG